MQNDPKTNLAIAGGAIAMALIDVLVTKGVLDRGTGLAILGDAQKRCGAISQPGAAKVVGDLYAKMSNGS